MLKTLNRYYTVFGAAVTVAAFDTSAAWAGAGAGGGGSFTPVQTTEYTDDSFSTIFERITNSFGGLPGLISMFAYLMGIIFAISGILKVKAHVEDPDKNPLKDGGVRLVVGGAFLALPTVMTAMTAMIGDDSGIRGPILERGTFGVGP